jgi:type II protein arginine methyltransferase
MVDKQQSHLIFGTREFNVHTIRDTLSSAEDLKVDFVVVPLFHPRLRRDMTGTSGSREGPVTRSDRELDSKDWIANIVGEISGWIDCDNPDPTTQKSSEKAMRQEFAWASHLGLQALVFPMPCLRSPNFAAIIQQLCAASTYQQLWVKIPLSVPLDFRNSRLNLNHVTDGWEVWDSLRHLAGHNDRLFCCLELSDDLPDDLSELKRWAAEPLKAIIIPTRIFLENKKGYPVLSKQHQAALSLLLQFKMHVIFSGKPKMQGSLTPYIQYIQHLRSRDVSLLTEGERFTFCYKDTLQSPLQPLMDNLESQTYETFERDPVKYERYEAAIVGALTDFSIASRSTGTSCPAEVVVTVVGAGRGPLVAAALSASDTTGVRIRVYAVEKNKNAIITLRNRVLTELWTNVTVIAGERRGVPRVASNMPAVPSCNCLHDISTFVRPITVRT